MDSRKPVFAAAAACLFYAFPAAAQTEAFSSGVAWTAVSEPDLAALRGRGMPYSKVFVQVNDNNTSNNYSNTQTGNPSSATVVVATPKTMVTGTASVGGAVIKPLVFAPVSFGRTIAVSFGSSSSNH
jgi:hypothetical protein